MGGIRLWRGPSDGERAAMQAGTDLIRRLMDRLLTDIHVRVDDNIDMDRYPGGHAEMLPALIQQSKTMFNSLVSHSDRLLEVHGLLADDASRTLLLDLLAYRLAGPLHVRLPTNQPPHWQARDDAAGCVRGDSTGALCEELGHLSRCEVTFRGQTIRLDCTRLNVAWTFLIAQYFFARGGVCIAPAPGDIVVDGGACAGDSALAFAAAVGDAGMVHAFEPCSGNLDLARHNLALNPWARAQVHPFGLSDQDQDGDPLPLRGISPGTSVCGVKHLSVPLRRIDTMVERGDIHRVDFIKLDVEGSDMAALAGAERTLRRFRPKLAISLYHRPQDIFEIPLWLRDLDLGYTFYLDHYTIFNEETILYAV